MTVPEDASRYGYRFAQQRLGFFEALETNKGIRVVVGSYEAVLMFFAMEF